jgi:hypothetical protein
MLLCHQTPLITNWFVVQLSQQLLRMKLGAKVNERGRWKATACGLPSLPLPPPPPLLVGHLFNSFSSLSLSLSPCAVLVGHPATALLAKVPVLAGQQGWQAGSQAREPIRQRFMSRLPAMQLLVFVEGWREALQRVAI